MSKTMINRIVWFEKTINEEFVTVVSPVDCNVTRCGKNLFSIGNIGSLTQNGVTVTNNNGELIIDGKLTTSGMFAFKLCEKIQPLQDENLVLSQDISPSIAHAFVNTFDFNFLHQQGLISLADCDKNYVIKNSTSDGVSLPMTNIFYLGIKNDFVYDNQRVHIQLELGDEKTDYEDYSGENFVLKANEPIKIPLLDGINTIFAEQDADLTVVREI